MTPPNPRRPVDRQRPEQAQNTQHLFRCKKTVGNHAKEERRHHGCYRADGIGPIDQIRHAGLGHKIAHRDVPGPKDEELQEHHYTEAGGHHGAEGDALRLIDETDGTPEQTRG